MTPAPDTNFGRGALLAAALAVLAAVAGFLWPSLFAVEDAPAFYQMITRIAGALAILAVILGWVSRDEPAGRQGLWIGGIVLVLAIAFLIYTFGTAPVVTAPT
jgi:peptidoglycan/LPS O-acetylase OafA/YrhL